MWEIAYVLSRNGWCIVDRCAVEQVIAGPYLTPEEAENALKQNDKVIDKAITPIYNHLV